MVAARRVSMPGMKTIVFSRTLRQEDNSQVTIIGREQKRALGALKASPGKDIWLFGGGMLFSSLAEDGLVDTVEVRIAPVLLGAGVPLSSNLKSRIQLTLITQSAYPSGMVSLEYAFK
jgi:dihydrofolate reductase